MVIIEKFQITKVNLSNILLSRLLIRDNSVVSSLTSSSCNVAGRRKGGNINRR